MSAGERPIPMARPWVGEEEAAAAGGVITSGWLTQGPMVEAFEREFAAYVGARYACAVSSCTAALQLVNHAIGLGPRDEVVTVSHSFIATVNPLVLRGAVPVFADIDPATFNIEPKQVESLLTPRTRAILCVHQLGMPCDLAALSEIAHRHGLLLIEDAACAAGSEIMVEERWEKIGRPRGLAACFSFHPRKILTTGDGGMITTNDSDLDARFRRLRQHGMSVSDLARHASGMIVFESYDEIGYNFRMTDIQAAVGRVQLGKLLAMVARRRELALRYHELLGGIPGLGLPSEPVWARSNWQSYCVRLPDGADQKSVMSRMLERGIATRRGVMNAHREPAFANVAWRGGGDRLASLRESENAQDQCIILPLFHDMTDGDQIRVAEALGAAWRPV